MAKLDRELTEKLFLIENLDDLKKLINEDKVDLERASRMALDQVLTKFFSTRCTGNKQNCIKMIVSRCNEGTQEAVENEPMAVDYNTIRKEARKENKSNKVSTAPKVDNITEEKRLYMIKTVVESMVATARNKEHYVYAKKLKRNPDLKILVATDDDIIKVSIDNPNVVAGIDREGVLYVMKRDQKVMDYYVEHSHNKFY